MAKIYAPMLEGNMYTKNETLKDVKDMTKNLVNGDFVYRSDVGEKSRRRQRCCLLGLGIGAALLVASLVVVTVIHEVQFSKLQAELTLLRTELDSLKGIHESLAQKLHQDYNGLSRTMEDTIYADDDDNKLTVVESKEAEKDRPSYEPLNKLLGLTTVLENDEDLEVDDYNDNENDAESGDWYSEYDNREKIGTTNMVKLKPEDFVDAAVLHVGKDGQSGSGAAIMREISRMLNENPENPDISIPKLVSTTQATEKPEEKREEKREKRSVLADVITTVDQFTAPKTVAKNDERRKTKKFTSEAKEKKINTISRIARNSDYDDTSARKPFVAAHFHGNTSHLNPDIHEHYKGNGLVRVSHDAAHDVWYPSPWTAAAAPHDRPTLTRAGHVHVHHTGVYLVYAQIYYLDTHDIISWVLHRTNADIEGRETLLQCAQSSHSAEHLERPNSCFSAAALFLKAGDRLAVRNTGGDRHSLMQPEKSFIGLIKLADAEDPTQEF